MVAARLLARAVEIVVDGARDHGRPCSVRGADRLAHDHCAALEKSRTHRPAAGDAARQRRHADCPAGRDCRGAGQDRRPAAARGAGLHRDRGPAILFALGDRPARYRPCGVDWLWRRLDHHPAARQVHLPHARTEPQPQGARGADRLLAGKLADQGRDPRTLSLQRLFRRQPVWAARREPPLLLPPTREAAARAGSDAGGAAAGALALCADQALRQGQSPHGAGHPVDGRGRLPDRGRGARTARSAHRRAHPRRQPADRHLFRRLGAAAGARGDGGELFQAGAHHHARFAAAGAGEPRGLARAAGRGAGRAGGDAPQWRGGGDGGRARLSQVALQPRYTGPPPARIDLQDLRLSRCARSRLGSRRHHPQHPDHARVLPPQKRARGLFRPDHAGGCLCPVQQRRRRAPAAGGGQRQGDPHRALARHHRADGRGRSKPRARHLGDDADGADRRLCRDRRQRLPGRTPRLRARRAGVVGMADHPQGQLLQRGSRGYRDHAARRAQPRDGAQCGAADRQFRQDRHHAGLPRRAVRGLCRRSRGWGVDRQ